MELAEVLGPIPQSSSTSRSIQENDDCEMQIFIDTMTGSRFLLTVSKLLQIYALKNVVAIRLNLQPDRICLIFKDCVLSSGTIIENGLCDFSTIRVFLTMETGTKDNANSTKKIGASIESGYNTDVDKEFSNIVESKQIEDFLAGTVALTVAVKTEQHTLLIQLKINSAITGQYLPCPKNAGKSGTVVDKLEQIAPGVVQGAFSGTIPICSSTQSGATFVPIDTVTDIVRDLVTYSAKAIGVPEVAASIADNPKQCISCCGFTAPDNTIENVNPSTSFNYQRTQCQQQHDTAVSPGSPTTNKKNTNITRRGEIEDRSLRKVAKTRSGGVSRLSSSRHRHHTGHSHRSSKSNSHSSSRHSRHSASADRYNEVTRMKMSILRAMLSK